MHKLFFCLMIFVFNFTFSQSYNGVLLDSITKKQVIEANIINFNKIYKTFSDANGEFKINIENPNDSIVISCIGYKKRIIYFDKLTFNKDNEIEILLVPLVEKLENVNLISKKATYRIVKNIGSNRKKFTPTAHQLGTEICNVLENTYNTPGILKTVILSFYRMDKPDYCPKYNLKFYRYDNVLNVPGEELSDKTVLFEPKNKTYTLRLDVDYLNIPFPVEGICIGFELIIPSITSARMTGANVAPYYMFAQSNHDTKIWIKHPNKKWEIYKLGERITNNKKTNKNSNNIMFNVDAKFRDN